MSTPSEMNPAAMTIAPTMLNTLAAEIETAMLAAEDAGTSLVIDVSAFAGQIVNILKQLSFRCPVSLVNKGAEPVVFTGGDWLISAAVTVENVVPPTAYLAPGATLTGEGVNAETTHKMIVVRTQSDMTTGLYETEAVAALQPTDKLIFDGFTGYWPAENTTGLKYLFDYAVEIAAGGVSLNNGFSNRTYYFETSLSGSGDINYNWLRATSTQWVFNGDVSAYTGSIKATSGLARPMSLQFNGDSEMNLGIEIGKTSSQLFISGNRTVNSRIAMAGSTVYVQENSAVTMAGEVTAGTLSVSGALSMSDTAAVTAANVSVASGASLTVEEGAEMAVSGTLTNNGTLRVDGMISAASLGGNGTTEFGENSVLKYSLSSAYDAEAALRSMLAAAEGLGAKNILIDVTALAGQTLQLSEPLALPMGVELRNTSEQAIRIEGEVSAPDGVALMGDWNTEALAVSEGALKLMVRLTDAESFESDVRAALQQAQQDGVSALVFEVTALAGQTLSLSEALELSMDVEFCNTAAETVYLTGAPLRTTAALTLSKGVEQDCLQGNYVGREQVSYVTGSMSVYTPADLADLSVAEGDTVLWMTDNQLATSVSIPELENVHHVSVSRNEMRFELPNIMRMEGLQNGPLTIHGAAGADAVVEIEDNTVSIATGLRLELLGSITQWGMDIRHLGSLSIARNTARAESEYLAGVDSGVACGELTFADIRTVAIVGNSAVAVTPNAWFAGAGAFAGQISFSDIDSLLVADNHAEGGDSVFAGAIDGAVEISHVNSAVFRGNYIKGDDGVTLRSIYALSESPITFTLSSGQRVAFYDTVYAEGTTLTLDAERGATLLFSGAEVRDTLAALGVELTAENVLRSSTSFAAEMLLNGGTLAVEDGAVLSGEQMTLAAGAELRISADAAVSLSGSLVSDGAIIIDFSKAGDGLYENILSYGSLSGSGTEVRAEGLTEGAVCVFYQEANGLSAYLNSKILVVSSAETEGPGSLAEALSTAAGMDATDELPVYIYLDALAGKTLDTAAYGPVEAPVALVNRSGESVTLTQALTLTRPSTLRNVTVAGDVTAEASLTLDGSTVQGKIELGTGEVLTILSEHGTTVVEGDIVNKGVLVLDGMLQINGEILSEEGSVLHGDNYGRVVALTDAATAEADMKRILADSAIKQVVFDVTALAGQTVQLHEATVWKTPAQIVNHGTETVSFEGGYWEMYAPVQLEGVSAPAVALLGNGALSGGNAEQLLNHKRLDVISQVSIGSGIMTEEVAAMTGADELVFNGFIGHLPGASVNLGTYQGTYHGTLVIADKGASISNVSTSSNYSLDGSIRGTGALVMVSSGTSYDSSSWNIGADMSCFYGSVQIADERMTRALNFTGDSDIHAASISLASSNHSISLSGHRTVITNLELPESTLTLAADSSLVLTGSLQAAQVNVQSGTTVRAGGEQSVHTLNVAGGSTYTLAEGGCLSMENGAVSGSGTMVAENGGELRLQGGTLALASLQAAAGAKVSLEGCALSNTRLVLSAEAELHFSGLDLSRTSITVTDATEGKMIDLSGNSWGTDSYAAIFAKLGDAAPYVTVDGVSYADLEEYDEVFPVTNVSSSASTRGSLGYALSHAAEVPFEKVVLVRVAPDLAGQAVVLTGDIALPHCSVEWVGNGLHVQSAAGGPERVVCVSDGSEVACGNLVFEGVCLSVESEGMLVMSDVTQTQSGCVVEAGAILWANDSSFESLEIGGHAELSNVEVADMCISGEGELFRLSVTGSGDIRVTDTLVFSDFAGTTGDVLSQVTWAEEAPEIRLTGSLSGAVISALPEGMAYTCASLEVAVGSSVAVESGAHLLSREAEPLHVRGTLTAAAGADLGEHVLVHAGGTLAMAGGAYRGTLTVEAGATLQLQGTDLSGMSLVISGQPSDLIDLSGNSWGTDNYGEIFAALGDAAPYVTIDGYTSLDFLGEGIYGVRLAAGDAETPGTLAWALERVASAPAEPTPEIVFSPQLSGQEVLLSGWVTTERDFVICGTEGVVLAPDGDSGLEFAAGHVSFEQWDCAAPVFVDAGAALTINGGRHFYIGGAVSDSTLILNGATVDWVLDPYGGTLEMNDSTVSELDVTDAALLSGAGNAVELVNLMDFTGSTENLVNSGFLAESETPTYIYLVSMAGDGTLATLSKAGTCVYAVASEKDGTGMVIPIDVPEGMTLSLQDGVQLVLAQDTELVVSGSLCTEGAYTSTKTALYSTEQGAHLSVAATGELSLQNAHLNLAGADNTLTVEGSLSMDGGRLAATAGVTLADGAAAALTGVTLGSALTVQSGAALTLTDCDLQNKTLTLAADAQLTLTGNDFSRATLVFTGLNANTRIDLTGNYWGENATLEDVADRLGEAVMPYLIIKDLPAADFTVTSVLPTGLLSAASDTLRVSFSHAVKADSLTADNTYLRAADGSVLHFTSMSLDGKELLLGFAPLPADGVYTLVIGGAVQSRYGTPLAGGAEGAEGYRLDLTADVTHETVLAVLPEKAFKPAYVDVVFSGAIDFATVTRSGLSLRTSGGAAATLGGMSMVSPDTLRISINSLPAFGDYTLILPEGMADAAGNAVQLPETPATVTVEAADVAASIEGNMEATVRPNGTVQPVVSLANKGNAAAEGLTAELWLTTGGSITSSSVLLAVSTAEMADALAAGAQVNWSPVVQLGSQSSAVRDGNYTLVVRVSAANELPAHGSNNTLSIGTLTVKTPELSLTVSDTQAREGGEALTYTVSRTGDCADELTVQLNSAQAQRLGLPETLTIAAGESSVSITAAVVNDAVFTGDAAAQVTVSAAGYKTSPAANLTIIEDETPALTLTLSHREVTEGSGSRVLYTITRQGDTSRALTVKLDCDEAARLGLPEVVTIAAGQSSAAFRAMPVNDRDYQGDVTAHLSVSAEGYLSGSATLLLHDDEIPGFSVVLDKSTACEGETVHAVVSMNTLCVTDTVVKLGSTYAAQISMPATVTIKAGQSSAEFDISVADDSVAEIDKKLNITASALGFVSGSAGLTVTDNDMPQVRLELSRQVISESDGYYALTAKLVRTGGSSEAISVRLSDPEGLGLILPNRAIPMNAGVNEVTFTIGVVDDALANGERTGSILGSITIADCGCDASSSAGGSFTTPITVLDNDSPALSLSLNKTALREGGEESLVLTVVSNYVSETDTVVRLSGNAGLNLPEYVTIPAGSSRTTCRVTAQSDGASLGTRPALIRAEATGFISSVTYLTVTDREMADLTVSGLVLPESGIAGQEISISYTITNQGYAATEAPFTVRVLLSDGTVLATETVQEALAPGASLTLTSAGRLPASTGMASVTVQVDADSGIAELDESNNYAAGSGLVLRSGYTFTAEVDKKVLFNSDTVTINGALHAEGLEVAGKPVSLYVFCGNSVLRKLDVQTDDRGHFSVECSVPAGVSGTMTVKGLIYTEMSEVLDSFAVAGLTVDTDMNSLHWALTPNGEAGGTITVRNNGAVDLHNVRLTVGALPDNVEIVLPEEGVSLAAGQRVSLAYTIKGTALSEGMYYSPIRFLVSCEEGVDTGFYGYSYVAAPAGDVALSTSRLTYVTNRNNERFVEFVITNNGQGETGAIRISVPDTGWMKVYSGEQIASLAPGESAKVVLALDASQADVALNAPYTGRIVVNSDNGGSETLNYDVTFVAEEKCSLTFHVSDSLTLANVGNAALRGARATLYNAYTNAVAAMGYSDEKGEVHFDNVEAGDYYLQINAENYSRYQTNISLSPGEQYVRDVYLSSESVVYTFTVVPTQVEDKYEIVQSVNFVTTVPEAIVMFDSTVDIPELDYGETVYVTFTVSNYGLVAAEGYEILLPQIDGLTMTILNPIDRLAAQSSHDFVMEVTADLPADMQADKGEALLVRPYSCKTTTLYQRWYECTSTGQLKLNATMLHTQGSCAEGDDNGSGGIQWIVPGDWISGHGQSWWKETLTDWLIGPKPQPGEGPGIQREPVKIKVQETASCTPCEAEMKNLELAVRNEMFMEVTLHQILADVSLASAEEHLDGVPLMSLNGSVVFKKTEEEIIRSLKAVLDECRRRTGKSGIDQEGTNSGNLWLQKCDAYLTAVEEACGMFDKALLYNTIPFDFEPVINSIRAAEGVVSAAEMSDFLVMLSGMLYEQDGRERLLTEQEAEKLGATAFAQQPGAEGVADLLAKWNRTVEYHRLGIRTQAALQPGMSVDFFSDEYVAGLRETYLNLYNKVTGAGYTSVADYYNALCKDFTTFVESEENSVCATVSLEFTQTAAMAREAFEGELTLQNNNSAGALENVTFQVTVKDLNGVDVSDHFRITYYGVTGMEFLPNEENNALVGATLASGSVGKVHIQYIADSTIAAEGAQQYRFSANLGYVDPNDGQSKALVLTPVTLTVNPSPNLQLHYFLSENSYSDDPFTEHIEAAQNAEIGLLVMNSGKGTAMNFTMSDFHPRYVSSEQGLALDVTMQGSRLNGGEMQSSGTTLSFGSLAGGSTSTAVWYFTTGLQGVFTDYEATFKRVDDMGNEVYVTNGTDVSLIDSVTTHMLVRSLNADGDDRTDFLVNDVEDALSMADGLYLGNGGYEAVNPVTSYISLSGGIGAETQMTIHLVEGWNYIRLTDPGAGDYRVEGITVGGEALAEGTFWQTDRYLSAKGEATYENRLHVLYNASSSGVVTLHLHYSSVDEKAPEVAAIEGVENRAILRDAPDTLTIRFSEAVNRDTFSAADNLVLKCQGETVSLSGVTATWQDDETLVLGNLGSVVTRNGLYSLSVYNKGVEDVYGNAGKGDGLNLSWTLAAGSLYLDSVSGVTERELNKRVENLIVRFSEGVAEFDSSKLHLVRRNADGTTTTIALGDGLQISRVDEAGLLYSVSGFYALQSGDGVYTLAIDTASMTDSMGEAGTVSAPVEWELHETPPTVVSAQLDERERLSNNVDSVVLVFSHSIRGIDGDTLVIRRNGTERSGNLLRVTVDEKDASRVVVSGLREAFAETGKSGAAVSAEDSIWEIGVNLSGVTDIYGNAGTGAYSNSWVLDATAPDNLSNVTINGGTSGVVAARDIVLDAVLPESGLNIAVYERSKAASGYGTLIATQQAEGTDLHLALALHSDGSRILTVVMQDSAGNSTVNEVAVYVDAVNVALSTDLDSSYSAMKDSILLTFTEAVSGLSSEAISLRVNGHSADVSGLQVARLNATQWQVSGLAAAVKESGQYTFAVDLSQVSKESSGLRGQGISSTDFIYDPITSVEISDCRMELRAGRLAGFSLSFSTDINAAALQASGHLPLAVRVVNKTSGESYLPSADGFRYENGTLTWQGEMELPAGDYTLVVDAALVTAANGAPLTPGGDGRSAHIVYDAAPVLLGSFGQSYTAPHAVDWNGDGAVDLLVGEKTASGEGKVRLYLNDGSYTFSSYSYLQSNGADLSVSASGCQGIVVATADVNGDGRPDLIAGLADGSVLKFLGTADGSFAAGTPVVDAAAVGSRAYPVICDWDGDGTDDLLIGTGDGRLLWAQGMLQDGALSFSTPVAVPGVSVSGRCAPVVTDVNGDGLTDLIVGDAQGGVSIFCNTGNGLVLIGRDSVSAVSDDRIRPTLVDVNADGVQDLIFGTKNGELYLISGRETEQAWMQDFSVSIAPTAEHLRAEIDGNNITFAWDTNGSSAGYRFRVQISTQEDFADVMQREVSGSSVTLSTMADGVYYWRLQVVAVDGSTGAWQNGTEILLDTVPPAVPGELCVNAVSDTVTVSWSPVGDAAGYILRYSRTADFAEAAEQSVAEPQCTLSGVESGTWYWQVAAEDASGNRSEWSTAVSADVQQLVIPEHAERRTWVRGISADADGTVHGFTADVAKLPDGSDSRLCWAAAAANMLAWWQQQYALAALAGTAPQGAESIMADFREHWNNVSGREQYGLIWWLSGKTDSASYNSFRELNEASAGGAWYAEYLNAEATDTLTCEVSLHGVEATSPGAAWSGVMEDGGIVSLGVYSTLYAGGGLSSGHTLTLWGFGVAENGLLTDITVSDSDDDVNGLVTYRLAYNLGSGYYQIAAPESKLHGYYLGDYTTLGAYIDVAADNTAQEATALSLTVSADGKQVASAPVRDWVGRTDAQDYYCFTAENAGNYAVNLNAAALTGPVVLSAFVLGENGEELRNKTVSVAEGTRFAGLSELTLAKGETCYIRMESVGGENAAYEFSVQGEVTTISRVTANNTAAQATKLSTYESGSALEGWVGVGDETDIYRVNVTGDGTLRIVLSGLAASAKIKVLTLAEDGSLKQVVAKNVKASAGYSNSLSVADGAVYYVAVSSYNASASQYDTTYQLSLEKDTPLADGSIETLVYGPADPRLTEDNTAETATLLAEAAESTSINGWVGRGDACDYYRLDVAGNGSLSVSLQQLETSAKVRIYTEDENGGLAQLVSKTVKAATGFDRTLSVLDGSVYYVQVLSYDDGAGNYNSGYSLTLESETEQEDGSKKTTHYGLASL